MEIKNKENNFYITYYATKHRRVISRKGKWTGDCFSSFRKSDGVPYLRYFDIDQNGMRTATGFYKLSYINKLN